MHEQLNEAQAITQSWQDTQYHQPTHTPKPNPAQRVAQEIVDLMKSGDIDWTKPWVWQPNQNAISRHIYSGINALFTQLIAIKKGYAQPYWLTFKQARTAGGAVNKGEKGTPLVHYQPRWTKNETNATTGKKEKVLVDRPYFAVKYVFNIAQTSVDPDSIGIAPPSTIITDTHEDADRFISLLKIPVEQASLAAYSPRRDIILMPPRSTFKTTEGYYHTLYHEAAHATGHPKRLNRFTDLPKQESKAEYAAEEVVAELAATFSLIQLGISINKENTAAYLQSWQRALSGNAADILSYTQKAQAATNYLLQKGNKQ